jgi:hypothetical protein
MFPSMKTSVRSSTAPAQSQDSIHDAYAKETTVKAQNAAFSQMRRLLTGAKEKRPTSRYKLAQD